MTSRHPAGAETNVDDACQHGGRRTHQIPTRIIIRAGKRTEEGGGEGLSNETDQTVLPSHSSGRRHLS